MVISRNLKSFHIIENVNGDTGSNLVTWTYPTITDELKRYLELKSLAFMGGESYLCLRRNLVWIYLKRITRDNSQQHNIAVALFTDEFNPSKYKSVCDLLAEKYNKCQNPVALVKIYLNLFTTGSCPKSDENGISCDLKHFKSRIDIKGLIRSFSLEIILVYNAILLKRRQIIFSKNIELLQTQLYSICHIIPTIRNVVDCLIPFVDTAKDLKGLSFYVAGTNNEKFLNENKLYDIFVNVDSLDITTSPQSKDVMSMCKIHKDMATLMVKLSESDFTDLEISEKITQKTLEIVKELKALSSITTAENNVKMLSLPVLKAKSYSPAVENFLFNLALAENIMML